MKEVNITSKELIPIKHETTNIENNPEVFHFKSREINIKRENREINIKPEEININSYTLEFKSREIQIQKDEKMFQIKPFEIIIKPEELVNSLGNNIINIFNIIEKINKTTEETISDIVKSIVRNNNLIINETIKSLNNNIIFVSKAFFDIFNENSIDTKNSIKTIITGIKEIIELGIDVNKIFIDTLLKNTANFEIRRKDKNTDSKIIPIDIK